MTGTTRQTPSWRDVRRSLRASIVPAFLAPLVPYKRLISHWIAPGVMKGQDVSVAKAKKAISNYMKAIGHPKGVAELLLFFCEEAVGMLLWCEMDDESYYAALVRMFNQALITICGLPEAERALVSRAPQSIEIEG